MKRFIQRGMILAIVMLMSLMSSLPAMAGQESVIPDNLQVKRLSGQDRYDTAVQISQSGWTGTAENAVLAAGVDTNLVDALTAAPLAKLKHAPLLLTPGEALGSQAEAELKRLQVKTVYLTSGSGVLKPAVTERLQDLGITVIDLGGENRFETAVNIAKQIEQEQPFRQVVISTAWSNADALSVAAIAASQGIPILLTDTEGMPAVVKTYVDSLNNELDTTYVIGGSSAVSDRVLAELPNARRAGGSNRYDTNLEILKLFIDEVKPGKIYIANGEDAHLVDALAGAPLAALTGSPVVLTSGTLPADLGEYLKLNLLPTEVVILGGENSVPGAAGSALTVWTSYNEAGALIGGASSAQPETIKNNILITADNVTVQNTVADYSVYLNGDHCALRNMTVKGTVFLDPGETGEAVLNNVKAGRIVVMSGGKNSIHLENTEAGTLVVTGDSGTRVEATGTTVVGQTVVTAYAVLDANGGLLGTVRISGEPGKTPVVELRGTFKDPVIVNSKAEVTLGSNTTVASMEVRKDSQINVPAGSSIGTATSADGVKASFSGSGNVNGAAVNQAPLPAAGGAGGGAVSNPASPQITVLRLLGPNGTELIAESDGTQVNITALNDTVQIKYIQLGVNTACTVKLTHIMDGSLRINAPGSPYEKTLTTGMADNKLDLDTILATYGIVTRGDNGVSLNSLRSVFSSDTLVFGGSIYQNDTLIESISLTINL